MSRDVAILGVGLHPFGRWRRGPLHYGVHAARAALSDAGVARGDVRALSAAASLRGGANGCFAAAAFAEALGLSEVALSTSYAACASGAQALAAARCQILSGEHDVVLVVGADVGPGGLMRPAVAGPPDDPEQLRHQLGLTNPVYLGLAARRRMALYGTTERQLSAVKVKNASHGAHNPNARYRQRLTLEQVNASPLLCDPLRLLHVCSTSDGGAAVVLSSLAYARRRAGRFVRLAAATTPSPRFPSAGIVMARLASDCRVARDAMPFREVIARAAYEQAGVGPEDLSLAEVYDLSPEAELDWYECLGLCPRGRAEGLLEAGATRIGGAIPVNPSGGLSSFGESPAAQVLAQLCELVWQLRGQAALRQVAGARVGLAVSEGIFGNGGGVVVKG